MRILFGIVGCLFVIKVSAQDVSKQQFIRLTYAPNRAYVEQATEKIESVSIVLTQTAVEYRAGRSIELSPGFQASQGAVFTAHIQELHENGLKLTAFPNPFDKSTTIDFNLPEAGVINLFIVDATGKVITSLLENSYQSAGKHQIEWQADAHSPGVYIPILKTGRQQASSRVVKK